MNIDKQTVFKCCNEIPKMQGTYIVKKKNKEANHVKITKSDEFDLFFEFYKLIF